MLRSIAIASCLAAALAGCGGPFFVSETDLRNVLGKEYLYAGTTAGVEAFDVDVETGRVTRLTGSPFGGGCLGALASTRYGTVLYAAPYVADSVYAFGIDGAGALSVLPGFPAVPTDGVTAYASARVMAVSPDGRFAHILHGGSTEALTSWEVEPDTGALSFRGSLGTGCAPYAAAIDRTGSHLYVSRGYPAAILHHTLAGGLPADQTVAVSLSSAPYRMVAHPSGYLYGMMMGGGEQNILAYRIDSASGALTAVSGSPYRLGFGPACISGLSLAIDRTGTRLYAVGEDDLLYVYRIDLDSGALTLSQGLGSANGGRVASSSSGRYVFVAGDVGGAGAIYVYAVNGDGSISPIDGSPYAYPGGTSYAALAVDTYRLP